MISVCDFFQIQGSQEQWRQVFFLAVGLYLFAWIIYMIFCKGDVQDWALPAGALNMEMVGLAILLYCFQAQIGRTLHKLATHSNASKSHLNVCTL